MVKWDSSKGYKYITIFTPHKQNKGQTLHDHINGY